MSHIVTLQQLLHIDKELSEISCQNKNQNSLITPTLCAQYDIKKIKKKLLLLFSDFTTAKYLYRFPIEENVKMTTDYKIIATTSKSNNTSKIENAVERFVDLQIKITKIYDAILALSSKFTDSEAIYMINTFITHHSEEDIAEILCVSRTYLQKIKKSCIIKMWTDLKDFCDEDD